MAPRMKGAERADRRRIAQRRIAPAEDQLLGLGEELDLADAAAPELDVVAQDRDPRMAGMSVDLALDRVDVLDGREVEVLAPDERLQVLEELSSRVPIAGTLTRLDPGGALPILSHALVVEFRGLGGDGDLCSAGIGA